MPLTVRELVAQLSRFDPDAIVRLSAGGKSLPHPHVGVGLDAWTREPCLVVADREAFPGRLPDLLLEADRPPRR